MAKKELFSDNLETTYSVTKPNGEVITVSTVCDDWGKVQKFLSEAKNTLNKG